MMEALIAGIVIALVGAVVSFGLRRLENHLDAQDAAAAARDTKINKALDQYGADIGAIAHKLRMRRREDGVLR